MNEFTLTLNSPLTEEQWDTITDVDFEHTNEITFHTKHGKEVVFKKASVQPEHRTGNWQDRRIIATNGNSLGIFRCSECKRASTITTAFCPNCGADMRGEQNETD